jgi:hypothetical protein
LAEGAQPILELVRRAAGVEVSNHGHLRLLRPHRQRPTCRTAEHRDELAPPHGTYPQGLGIRAGLKLGRSPIYVRRTPNSDRKFKAHLFVAMCQLET